MAPHNAARHALVPATGELQIFWTDAKARMLSQALQGLNQTATPIPADAARMVDVGRGCPARLVEKVVGGGERDGVSRGS